MSRFMFVVVVWLAAGAVPGQLPAAETAADAWIPDSTLLSLHITKPKQLIERVLDERIVSRITELPQYQTAMAGKQAQELLNLVQLLEAHHNLDLRTLVTKLLGGGITVAVGPEETFLLIIDTEDAELLEKTHDFFLMIARSEAQKQGQPDRVKSAEYGGVTGWTFGPNETHAMIEGRLVVANKPEVLKAVIDLRSGTGGASLATSADFQAAASAVDEQAVAFLYANMSVLKQLPDLQQSLSQNENPLGRLLLAPFLSAIGRASWLAAGVTLDGDELALEFTTAAAGDELAVVDDFAVPAQPGQGAMPNLAVPRQIAGVSLYRDLHEFYASKDTLFPERTSGLIFFENMMGIFFTGRDLTEEVLAETLPDVRLVVAEQKYDEKTGTPQMQIPGFAAVIRLREPDKFVPVVEEAWQKAIGLANFTRGQQALPGLIIDRPVQGDTKYTSAAFSVAEETDTTEVDMRFNFQPAVATQGDHLILASTDVLTRDLIDALQQEDVARTKPLPGQHSVVRLDGGQLASILDANRNSLVRQTMVDDGKTRAEAELQWQMIINVLQHIRYVTMDAGVEDGKSKLTLRIAYAL